MSANVHILRRVGCRACAGGLLLLLGSCGHKAGDVSAHSDDPPEPVALRCQLASDTPRAGFAGQRGLDGQPLYVSPQIEFDNADVLEARVLRSARRAMLEITLNPLAARRLHELTREYVGFGLAVFLDDALVATLPIYGPDAGGRIPVIADFTNDRFERLAAGLNRRSRP